MVHKRVWLPVACSGVAVALAAACTPAPRLVDTPVSSPENTAADTNEVVVGVDSVAGGYNPHNLADQSPVTTALSQLLLPSVFRPGPDGTPQLDDTLMTSAEVTNFEPYTVTYEIRGDASWSDAAPVAAEDFVYLWEQVTGTAGTIDAAGYRLISDINARDGGKVVEVVFAKTYPGWRSLFSDLLPAHLLKDAPGGWAGALRTNFPTTAGPYKVKTMDTDRGQIVLERSDRYWAEPPTLDRIILRRAEQDALVDALEAGHDQLALARTDSVGTNSLGGLAPTITSHAVPRPAVTTLLVRPEPQLADLPVRQALIALLDRTQLITVGTGNGPAATLRADTQVLAPSAPGYGPTIPTGADTATPARQDTALAEQLLTGAGFARTSAGWSRDGRPLSLTIAAAEERTADQRIATEVQRQLTASGITAEVVTPPGADLLPRLYDEPAAGETDAIDLAVISRPTGGDPATALATGYGCTTDPERQSTLIPANPTGYCDPALQPTMDAALTGSLSVAEALTSIEPALWRAAVAVPLYQEAETLAIRPEITGVTVGPPFAGPFAGAAKWARVS